MTNGPTTSKPRSMSSQCKPSCTPAPSQWQRHHAIQAEAPCITPKNKRRYLKGIPFQRRRVQEKSGSTKKNLGPKANGWLLTMLNKCFMENQIPTLWRQSNIIVILKPGKDSAIRKRYRLIIVWCHKYKLRKNVIIRAIN